MFSKILLSLVLVSSLTALSHAAMGKNQVPPPPFLQGAPETTVTQFQQLIDNSYMKSDAQIHREVEEWIGKQSATIKAKFAQFKQMVERQKSESERAHQQAIAGFSPEARAADAELAAVANNPSLTAQQKGAEIERIVNSLPVKVRTEIEQAMQG